MKIAFSGFLRDQSGFGESGRRLVRALQSVGADVEPGQILDNGAGATTKDRWALEFCERPARLDPTVHVVYTIAPEFTIVAEPGTRTVGITCVETDIPHDAYVAGCADVDLLIVPSEHNRDAFEDAHIPAVVIPFPTADPAEMSVEPLAMKGVFDEKTFVFYLMSTWQERKNVEGALIAYLTTFTGYDDVAFVMKIAAPVYMAPQIERRVAEIIDTVNVPNPPRVHVVVGIWDERTLWSLHRRGDCYVHLSRGEAFGLTVLDALTIGNQVIATEWGGHLDFLTVEEMELVHGLPGPMTRQCVRRPLDGVHLVRARLTPVVQRWPYFNGRMAWADPDLYEASAAMSMAVAAGREKRRHDLSSFSPTTVGRRLAAALEDRDV